MKTQRIPLLVMGSIIIALACASSVAQQPLITSFHSNGQLTWTNLPGTNGFTVQWAPEVTGPWSSDWHTLESIISPGGQTSVAVPMFYQVAQGFSAASMRGLWIASFPTSEAVYFRAEDDGLLSEVGMFNLRTPNGYFTVSPSGTATVTWLWKSAAPTRFSFQLGQQTSGSGGFFRVDNAALCAGHWSGSLSQTNGPGSPVTHPVSFDVDSFGWIINLTGFSPVVTGRLFAITNGPAAGFITTGEGGLYNQIAISGTLTGNTLTGSYDADYSTGFGAFLGIVSLTRQ